MTARPWDRLPAITLPEGGRLSAFDGGVDTFFADHLRGRPRVDRVFYLASALGDHGILWIGLALAAAVRRSRRSRRRADRAPTSSEARRDVWLRPLLRAVVGLTVESVVVNGPVKLLFRRERPRHDGPRPLPLRQPRTSSFPSGHATAAFLAAALLRDDDPAWPAYYVAAVLVAFSRVHVRIHHGSDVMGGIVTGALLGEAIRHAVPVAGTPHRPPALTRP